MSATSMQVTTWSLPNEDYTRGDDYQPQPIPAQISYRKLFQDIRTLSTNNADGNDQTGLLYTPDLEGGDACIAESASYVQNVTRIANLPPSVSEYRVMAIAPWTSGECALSYMVAARVNPNNRGFLFFWPDGMSTVTPASDRRWHIDGSWKRDNGFPVYAIPGRYGAELLALSAAYNGNVTDVPFGHELTESGIAPTDYVRLFADIDTGSRTSLPSLWVFLLIVLAVLLVIIAMTSLAMHLIQRRRRHGLRRRIASGEVDLEALGIKRLTISQELLDQMPIYTYGTGNSDRSLAQEKLAGDMPTNHFTPSALQQPTCPICLEDFETASPEQSGSTVRELPCQHIFHPECVDSFLRMNSSLCPMCKKSALPKGYCPEAVTNAMVRRERNLRRIRNNIHSSSPEMPGFGNGNIVTRLLNQRLRTIPGFGRRFRTTSPITESQRMEEIDMRVAESATNPSSSPGPGAPRPLPSARERSTLGQREWARQRALAMVGRSGPVDPDVEESQQAPAWRKAVRKLFPGFGS